VFIALFINFDRARYFRLQNISELDELDKNYKLNKPRVRSFYKVVITLTTIPDRVNLLYPTIASLFDQTVYVDEIILNLPYVSRKGKPYIVPEWMEKLENLTIRRLDKDEGPATKLLPTLREERKPHNIRNHTRIMVVDDDNIYQRGNVESLINDFETANRLSPTAVTKFGVRLSKNGVIPGFSAWSRGSLLFQCQQEVDLLQGCFGFVVLASFFNEAALDIEHRPDFATSVDDIWFSCWLTLNNIPILNTSNAFWTLPLLNMGKIASTPRLVNTENAGLIRDHDTIAWFRDTYGYKHVLLR
jgi:hypothetical protein